MRAVAMPFIITLDQKAKIQRKIGESSLFYLKEKEKDAEKKRAGKMDTKNIGVW